MLTSSSQELIGQCKINVVYSILLGKETNWKIHDPHPTPFLGLLKILDKEHHFIMPIINENTSIIKNDKCKKKPKKNPKYTKSGIISKYIFSTKGFIDFLEQKIPPSPFLDVHEYMISYQKSSSIKKLLISQNLS